jgi:hypothetical protein
MVVGKPDAPGAAKKTQPPQLPAGVLTAGSFDDNLFPEPYHKFVERVSRSQSAQDLPSRFLGHRVVITVKNGEGRPVGNARVHVAAEGGNGVTLLTRTDGRAVFVASWDQVPADADLTLTVTPLDGGPPVKHIVPRLANQATVTLPKAPAPLPQHLDLVLVLDATGSMGDELEYLKAEIKSIAGAVSQRFPNVKQRYSLIQYRDEGTGDEYAVRAFPLTGSLDEFRNQLNAQRAGGGGDYPEAMHLGLEEAVKLGWRGDHTARVLFLVADAPPHARHAKRTLDAVDALRKKGVAIYPVAASGSDDACEFVMRTAAVLTGGQYLFLTDDSGVGNAHAEPHIPFYHVEKLNQLMIRLIAGELSGRRVEPEQGQIIRTVGQPPQVAGKQ